VRLCDRRSLVEAQRIGREDLEASLSALRAEVRDSRVGLFGPDTVTWRVLREAALLLGAGRAALLQLAHPYVAKAIADHSLVRSDPLQRAQRTFRHVFRMVFGDLDQAVATGRAVHRVHEHIHGTLDEDAGPFRGGRRYDATEIEAQIWVLATLWDTSLLVYERIFGPLSRAEGEQLAAEGRRIAMLFGVEHALPPDVDALRAYVDAMLASDTLTVTRVAAEIGRHIRKPGYVLGRFVADDYTLLTAHLLPERLADAFGLERRGSAGSRRAERVLSLVRTATPRLPARLRFFPPYLAALRRIQGRTRRDRVGEWMHALYLGAPP
jgi:uncharacterized protein (DUF2236 family)